MKSFNLLMETTRDNVYAAEAHRLQKILHSSGTAGVPQMVLWQSDIPPAVLAQLKYCDIMAKHPDDRNAGLQEVCQTLTIEEGLYIKAAMTTASN